MRTHRDSANPACSSEVLTQGLDHLGYRRLSPHPALCQWVESYWSVRCNPTPDTKQNLYPDGATSLIFKFSGSPHASFNATQALRQLSLPGDADLFGLRFHPAGAFHLLGLPIGELVAGPCNAATLELPGLEALIDQMRPASPPQRAQLLDSWLLKQAARCGSEPNKIARFWPRLFRTHLSTDQLLDGWGASRRTVERLFRQQVGLAPHEARLLLRVKQARTLIKQEADLSLTDLALTCGYYDQAHFIRQFRRVTGVTPGNYRRRHRAHLSTSGP